MGRAPAEQVEAALSQTAESLATVPLLGLAFEREGIDAPVTNGLGRVLDGGASPDQWLESVRSARASAAQEPRRLSGSRLR